MVDFFLLSRAGKCRTGIAAAAPYNIGLVSKKEIITIHVE